FERSASVLDGPFWLDIARAIPDELRSVGILLRAWASFIDDNGGYGRIAAALATLAAFAGAVILFPRRRKPPPRDGAPPGRLAGAVAALRALVATALPLPAGMAVAVATLNGFGLMPGRIVDIATGLLVAVFVATIGRGIAKSLLVPAPPARRMLPIDD